MSTDNDTTDCMADRMADDSAADRGESGRVGTGALPGPPTPAGSSAGVATGAAGRPSWWRGVVDSAVSDAKAQGLLVDAGTVDPFADEGVPSLSPFALALSVGAVEDPEDLLLGRCVAAELVPNPVMAALLRELGWRMVGRGTWALSLGPRNGDRPSKLASPAPSTRQVGVGLVLAAVDGMWWGSEAAFSEWWEERGGQRVADASLVERLCSLTRAHEERRRQLWRDWPGLRKRYIEERRTGLRSSMGTYPVLDRAVLGLLGGAYDGLAVVARHLRGSWGRLVPGPTTEPRGLIAGERPASEDEPGPWSHTQPLEFHSFAKVESGQLWVRFVAAGTVGGRQLRQALPSGDGDAVAVTIDEAAEAVEALALDGVPSVLVDPKGGEASFGWGPDLLCRVARHAKVVRPDGPSRPGRAVVVAGAGAGAYGSPVEREHRVAAVRACATKAGGHPLLAVHPDVADVAGIARAEPVRLPELRPSQGTFVGRYLAARRGLPNLSSPGAGKTRMATVAMRLAAGDACEQGRPYRALVVCPAGVRREWEAEVRSHFPGCSLRVAASGRALDEALEEARSAVAGRPVVVVTSVTQATASAETVASVRWDDCFYDEADGLRNSSRQTEAMWLVREACARACAMTGTPTERRLGEVGPLVAWSLGDREVRALAGDGKGLAEDFGPLIFRVDSMELADELPELDTSTVRVEGRPAEVELAEAARVRLREAYDRLVEALEALEALGEDDPELVEARRELREARGAVLGGVTIARMATVVPEALERSRAAAAMLLAEEGLVAPAVAAGCTKRRRVVEGATELAGECRGVVCFSDFAQGLALLHEEATAAGLRSGLLTGRQGVSARDATLAAWDAGEIDLLCCGVVGERGLNLQLRPGGAALVHLDLPWSIRAFRQRCGRLWRPGYGAESVDNALLVLGGTVDERVATILCAKAGQLASLDAALSGRRGRSGEYGSLMGDLPSEARAEAAKDWHGLFEMAKAVLAD